MRMIDLLAILALVLPIPSAFAQDDHGQTCSLDLDVRGEVSWRGVYGRGYEASSPSIAEPASVVVRHEGSPCAYFVVVSGAQSGLGGPGGSLSFDVLDAPSGRSIASADQMGSSGMRLQGAFREGEEEEQQPIFVSIPPGQNVRGGSYAGVAMISLYEDGAVPRLVRQAPLPVSARVPPTLSVMSPLFGAGRAASVSLGQLSNGARADIDFLVTSNGGVSVRLSSGSGGQLVHQTGLLSLPYRASLAGRRIELSSGPVSQSFPVSPGVSASLPLSIEVDPVPGAAAGSYSDTLTITFSSDG